MKTRERILLVSLELFNAEGEPNVTTVDISNELGISPGNLYYHFKGKDEIVNELFARFYEQFNVILRAPLQRPLAIEDYWFYLVVLFEHINTYRFLYRNISLISQRYEQIQRPLLRIIKMKVDASQAICDQMKAAGAIKIDDDLIPALANNMALTITYWLNFDNLLNNRSGDAGQLIRDGVMQVITQIVPYMAELKAPFMEAVTALYNNYRE